MMIIEYCNYWLDQGLFISVDATAGNKDTFNLAVVNKTFYYWR